MKNGPEIAPMVPAAKRGGNKRTVNIREVVNGVMYVLSTGCQWRSLPKDPPPKAWCMTASTAGPMTARWSDSTNVESRPREKPAQRQQ